MESNDLDKLYKKNKKSKNKKKDVDVEMGLKQKNIDEIDVK